MEGCQAMSKDKLRELLSQLWIQDISADEAFDELEDLINHIKRLEESENRLLNWLTEDCPESVKKQLSNAWTAAKEAKP
jgi:hypothetical protein